MAIKIIIGDDHPVVLNGLSHYLSSIPNFDIVGLGANGFEVYQLYEEYSSDVIIMDISMPVMDGLETAKRILGSNRSMKIIFYSVNLCRNEIYYTYKLGGKGFVSKESNMEKFKYAINNVYQNKVYFDSCFTEKHFLEYEKKCEISHSKRSRLNNRQKEILALVAQGYTNKDIAERLILSIRTVENNKRIIRQKLGLVGSAELIKFALEQNKNKEYCS